MQSGRLLRSNCTPVAGLRPAAVSRQCNVSCRLSPLQPSSFKTGSAVTHPPCTARRQSKARRAQVVAPQAKIKDPDLDEGVSTLKGPPSLLWKVLAALTYLIPWIDTITLGREIYRNFPNFLWLYFLPGQTVKVYYSSQFAPLIIFFLVFLTIVKNTKLHHFVRFNCMQAVMLDIVCMLFHIIRNYFPAEIRWSMLLPAFDKFAFVTSMTTIVYCVYYTLRGKYADIPFVSEAVYIQVDASEYG